MSQSPTVIVSGLPRSGTSMMMQMLEAGGVEPLTDRQRTADADNPRGYYEHEAIKNLATDASVLLGAEGLAAKVIHRLLRHLPTGPRYAVVFVHRDPDEVLASQQAMLDRLGRAGARLDPARLRTLYAKEVEAALREVRQRSDAELLEIEHAQVIADPAEAADRVASFIESCDGWEGTLDRDAMSAVVDPTLFRQRGGG